MVRPASRTFNASSLGVFWREAPSTKAIMRSRKLEPSSAVMRTLMRSDRTLVPPVTAERSPPASRTTGADSPVMADSSMVATPSTISPSPGTMSPASTRTIWPTFSAWARTGSKMSLTPTRTLAMVSLRIRRSVSAWALPRPSATASAKVANSTVTHSQATIWISKPMPGARTTMSRTISTVATSATSSTVNITGFFISSRGCSLVKLATRAGFRMAASNSDCDLSRVLMIAPLRTACRPASRSVPRWVRGRAPAGR